MIVAVAEDRGARRPPRTDRRPELVPVGDGGRAEAELGFQPRQPFGKDVAGGLQGDLVIIQQRPGDAWRGEGRRRDHAVQFYQPLDSGVVERGLIEAPGDQHGEEVVAEIFQNRQALGRVMGQDGRRRQALGLQPLGHGDEGVHPTGGEAGERIVAGLGAVLGRGVRMTGRGLGVRRLVHEDQAGAGRRIQPLIGPGGSVAAQRRPAGLAPAVPGQEGGLDGLTIGTQTHVLPRRRWGSEARGARPRRW